MQELEQLGKVPDTTSQSYSKMLDAEKLKPGPPLTAYYMDQVCLLPKKYSNLDFRSTKKLETSENHKRFWASAFLNPEVKSNGWTGLLVRSREREGERESLNRKNRHRRRSYPVRYSFLKKKKTKKKTATNPNLQKSNLSRTDLFSDKGKDVDNDSTGTDATISTSSTDSTSGTDAEVFERADAGYGQSQRMFVILLVFFDFLWQFSSVSLC